ALEIGDVDPHAGERAPVLVVGDAARERDVAKARVALIEEEEVGTRIVRDDEIDAAVIAEVPDRDSERFSSQRGETGALRGVLIGRVAAVEVETRGDAAVAIGRRERLVRAIESREDLEVGRPLDISGDEEIEIPIGIDVGPGRRGRPDLMLAAGGVPPTLPS